MPPAINMVLKMADEELIKISHGSGGRLTLDLIKDIFLKELANPILLKLDDAAVLNLDYKKIAFTTDTYTVHPLFFPGGDIGKLSICGTVNDLSVIGAKPLYISASFLIEEGFKIKDIKRIVRSMAHTAMVCGVKIVCGDTKVIERTHQGGLFINTSGIGILRKGIPTNKITSGDKIIISGCLGEHEMAILCSRENLGFEAKIKSDCAPLNDLIAKVLDTTGGVKFMRDPTRGGLATVLNELVEGRTFGIILFEQDIPIKKDVRAVCELLGYEPLYLANEGKVVFVVDEIGRAHV